MWNIQAALSYVRSHAQPHTTHWCARYVTAAIEHGGVTLHHDDAKNMGPYLVLAGFHAVYGNPIAGDLAIIQPYPGGSRAGHMCIYDGQTWWSDFKQLSMYPGPGYRSHHPAYQLYRHN